MIPLHLTVSGFLSYRDPVEIDFTPFDLACISGANGSGKSSLLDAITWVLFGQARKRDESIINSASKAAEVALIFAYEGGIYRVQRTLPRGKTSLLEFQISKRQNDDPAPDPADPPVKRFGPWTPITEASLRQTQARIEKTLNMDYETFVNASFFLQGKADSFTQQRPGDRKRILSSILGLDVWEDYRQRAAEKKRAVEADIIALDATLTEINAELSQEDARKQQLAALETELASLSSARKTQEAALENIRKLAALLAERRKQVDENRRRLEADRKTLEDAQSLAASRRRERDLYREKLAHAEQIEAAYTAWQNSRTLLAQFEETAARFREQEARRQEPLRAIAEAKAGIQKEVEGLQAQERQAEANEREIAQYTSELNQFQEALAKLEAEYARKAELEEKLNAARQRHEAAKAENPLLKTQMSELKERIDQLSVVEGATCPLCGQTLTQAERERLIEELTQEGTLLGNRYRANTAYLQQANETVTGLEKEIAALNRLERDLRTYSQSQAQRQTQIQLAQSRVEEWKQQGLPRLEELCAALEAETYAPESRRALAEIDAELKVIGYDIDAHEKVRKAELMGRSSEAELRALESARAALAPLEREIETLEKQIERQSEAVEREEERCRESEMELEKLEAETPDLRSAEMDLLRIQERENQARMEVGRARQQVDVLEGLKFRKRDLESQREDLARLQGRYKQLERAFGKDGVPALLIEQALPQIENRANEILERLSNGSMSVRFITQAQYKDRRREDLKETLDIQISDGSGSRDYEMYSGGEAFRVNFAIRLALSEVLTQRAGARLQTLVIDEGFGSQDALGRQRLVEAINLVARDFAKILVITHIDELKDAFPARIEVEKTIAGSRAKVVTS